MDIPIIASNQQTAFLVDSVVESCRDESKRIIDIKFARGCDSGCLRVFNFCDFRLHFAQQCGPRESQLRCHVAQRQGLRGPIPRHGAAGAVIANQRLFIIVVE